jgi:hypothetical protein
MFGRSFHICAIALSGVLMLGGCSSMSGKQTAEAEGSQVGEAVGQEAGTHAARNVPYVGGMLGGMAGKHVGAEAGKAAAGDDSSAQPAGAHAPAN